MFKPNIRGVGKKNLRFELAGWRNHQDESLIKHPYPWRHSWIELVAGDSSLTPVLARSGQVFLVQSSAPAMANIAATKSRLSPRKYLLFSLISGLGVLASVMLMPIDSEIRTSSDNSDEPSVILDCANVLQNPEQEITKWLNGTASNQASIQEAQREELGGVQFRRINASCGDQQVKIQITLTLRDKTWQLKKFTRLAN